MINKWKINHRFQPTNLRSSVNNNFEVSIKKNKTKYFKQSNKRNPKGPVTKTVLNT